MSALSAGWFSPTHRELAPSFPKLESPSSSPSSFRACEISRISFRPPPEVSASAASTHIGDARNARIPMSSMPWLAVRLSRKFSAKRPSVGYTPSTCPTSSMRNRRAISTMVRYSVVRRTEPGRAALPISRSNPPERALSDRMARSGSDSTYV